MLCVVGILVHCLVQRNPENSFICRFTYGRVSHKKIQEYQQYRRTGNTVALLSGQDRTCQKQKQQIKHCAADHLPNRVRYNEGGQKLRKAVRIFCQQQIPREEMLPQYIGFEIINQGHYRKNNGGNQRRCKHSAEQTGKRQKNKHDQKQAEHKRTRLLMHQRIKLVPRAIGKEITCKRQIKREKGHTKPQDRFCQTAAVEKFIYFILHFAKNIHIQKPLFMRCHAFLQITLILASPGKIFKKRQ